MTLGFAIFTGIGCLMNALPFARIAVTPSAQGPGETARVTRFRGEFRRDVPVFLTKGSDSALVVAVEVLTGLRHGLCMIEAGDVLSEFKAARVLYSVLSAAVPMAAHEGGACACLSVG